jgi:kynurenine formamidase
MDAPAHFDADGKTAEKLPPSQLVAPLIRIDVTARANSDPDTQGTVDDLLAWETEHGEIPTGAFVALYSDWDRLILFPDRYIGLDDANVAHFPGWHPDAAEFLVTQRQIVGIGVDTVSLDYGASTDFLSHVNLLTAGRYGLENLANLARVPPIGATIVVGGPKHLNASGGPTRAFALI